MKWGPQAQSNTEKAQVPLFKINNGHFIEENSHALTSGRYSAYIVRNG